MEKISVKAFGKINLGLAVLGRRNNGYHDVSMVMQTVGIYDTIELKIMEKNEIILSSNRADLPLDETNIVFKAIQLIKERFSIKKGISAHVHKVLPIAAGMGGGSADAAATLKGMNELFQLALSEEALREFGLILGADVPFLIMGGTALAEGIGEKLRKLPSPPKCHLVLAKPNISVSTKEVYEAFDSLNKPFIPKMETLIKALEEEALEDLGKALGNSLEGVTITKYPLIEEIKKKMMEEGAMAALMTGSGPTVFGLFEEKEKAEKAKSKLEKLPFMESVFVTEWFDGE